jgi:pimeloyl-ACP methyl ester carboxylesterase/DNA-binding CsgD family transcriptional regulator
MDSLSAQKFLNVFRREAGLGRALEALAADVDGFSAALHAAPDDLGNAMAEAATNAGGAATVPSSVFASAACTADGRILASDETFAVCNFSAMTLTSALGIAGPGAPHLSAIIDDVSGRPVAIAIAELSKARQWPLAKPVRDSLEDGTAKFAILGVRSMDGSAWTHLLAAWRFTPSEARIAVALVKTGSLRESATQAGVSYETARGLVAAAMDKTGSKRQPEFVQLLVSMVFGDLPSSDTTWRTFADAFGLSQRQGQLAQLISFGATRAAAAAVLKISDQSAKADLKIIFENCGIQKGAALGRIVAEMDALTRLASATQIEIHTEGSMIEPLRFVRRRRAPGRIALSDHGPSDAMPVIVFHTTIAGRHLPHVLVEALQANGMRPIAVDRPGFGLTSPADGDVFEDANADLIDVLDALEIGKASLLGRSCVMSLAFAAAHPERFEQGVLLASKLAPGMTANAGLYGIVSRMVRKHPQLIGALTQMLMNHSSIKAATKLTERTIDKCPSDIAAFSDPRNRRDFIHGTLQCSSSIGFVRELPFHVDGPVVPSGTRDLSWTILTGDRDGFGEGQDGIAGWKAALPRARLTIIPDGGRFLHMSHATDVADAFGRHVGCD